MSAISPTTSRLTLRSSFFENLWPLILQDNRCDTHSKDTSEYFVPKQRFDELWAHTLLAARGYKNYEKPIEFRCYQPEDIAEADEGEAKDAPIPEQTGTTSKGTPPIVSLERQIHALQQVEELRQKLAYDYVNRKYPWYMDRPIYERGAYDMHTDVDVSQHFVDNFEVDILRHIHTFECKLMLIDVAGTVPLQEMERWVKYCSYVQMLVTVRCEVLARHLQIFNGAFIPVLIEENLENTWHEELHTALEAGLQRAKELKLFNDCGKPFVFVFSSIRGICRCDTFKILRTS